ncbi:(R)-phenyllactyl-CoA dehydratase alpha subunit [subsurface metagenome]
MVEKYADHKELLNLMNFLMPLISSNEDLRHQQAIIMYNKYWIELVLKAEEEGEKIVYNQFNMYAELFHVFDLVPVPPEIWTLLKCGLRDGYGMCETIDAAHEAGIHPELCSAHKSAIGDQLLGNRIPPPDMIVNPSFPCDNTKIAYQILAEITGAPMLVMDCPYFGPDIDEEAAMEYWVNRVKELIRFLEEHSGKKLDPDRLKEVVEEANRAVDYALEYASYRQLKPLPQPGPGGGTAMGGMNLMGLPQYTELMKGLLDDIKDRVAKGKTAVPEEKLRLNWFYLHAFYDRDVYGWLEREKGAVSPISFATYDRLEVIDTSTTESIIRGVARRLLQFPMGRQGTGSSDIYIDDCIDAVTRWQCDAVILSGHAGCKYIRGLIGLLRDELRKMGVPLLVFDEDTFDPRVSPPEEFHPKIEEFVDMCLASKE